MTINVVNQVSWSNIGATPATFTLRGGLYFIGLTATWGGGNAVLQRATPAGNFIAVGAAITTDGSATYQLPAGTYKLLITTATALSGDLISIV